MPSIAHEAPLELLRGDPHLAAVLLQGLGVSVPSGATAQLVSADLTASLPAEFRADAVVMLSGAGGRLAVIVEVQLSYDTDKEYTWPSYLSQVRAAHRCPAAILVICVDAATADRCRAPIVTGHPDFDLKPLVIDAVTTPRPGETTNQAGPELTVLAVLTGALDLDDDSVRRAVLTGLATLDESRRKSYTAFVLNAASAAAQQALEVLMPTTQFSHPFIDRYIAEGKAEGLAEGKAEGLAEGEVRGEARMILRILTARGLQVPDEIRERLLSCADTAQLEEWGDKAATAAAVEDVFGS